MPIQSHSPSPLPLRPEKMGLYIRKVLASREAPSKERFAVYGIVNTWNSWPLISANYLLLRPVRYGERTLAGGLVQVLDLSETA